ncbi:hypothetical protein SEPCBS119000_003986 [Sporothrix epigloea]|uniref:Uncharacterized protein n=1 Tax=Sporothrix epigloea TaxID=1892477 RepID=A0ABP0DQY8_9PEZI
MSSHNGSPSGRSEGKTDVHAEETHAPSHCQDTLSSANSVYSETSSYYPVKDHASPKPSKSSSLKSWTKGLVSDLGKPPTHQHDAVHGADTKQPGFWNNPHTKI